MASAKAKNKTIYVCNECGASSPRWLGRCPACQAWSSLVEERARPSSSTRLSGGSARSSSAQPIALGDVRSDAAERLPTGIAELDRVLGGGPVVGGVVLVGGDPGIGKSTLLLQALSGMQAAGLKTLYVSGEESAAQVAMRARRVEASGVEQVQILATIELSDVEAALEALRPEAVVVDSIQTMRSAELDSAPGSVAQLREVTARLVDRAKADGVTLFLIGHVTKDGALAGPKVLEHLVDTVLSFEGDASAVYRLLRGLKNRFGPAHELGVFEMVREGMREVTDPSALFLSERPSGAPGSIVLPSAQGQRPLLLEVQALVAPAAYGSARRVATGVDANRLAILLAVLDRKAQVQVLDQDVFVNVVGGARVDEPAADLALAVAVVSSLRSRAVTDGTVVFGEVGLTGEVRAVPRIAQRLSEARKLGFSRVVLPAGGLERLGAAERGGLELCPVRNVDEALREAFVR